MNHRILALLISPCLIWACSDSDGHERVDTGKCHDHCPKCNQQKEKT